MPVEHADFQVEFDAALAATSAVMAAVDSAVATAVPPAVATEFAGEFDNSLNDSQPIVDARKLGCLARHQSAGFNNSTAFQAFLNDRGGAATHSRKRLELESGWYGFQSALSAPFTIGGSIKGVGGHTGGIGYDQLATFKDCTTRLVAEAALGAGVPFLALPCQGLELSGLVLQGYSADTAANARAAYASFNDLGILIPDTVGSNTTGKVHGNSLGLAYWKTGMQLGEDPVAGEQADDPMWDRLFLDNCHVGVHVKTKQVVNGIPGFIHSQGCGNALYLEAGGNWSIGHVYHGALGSIPKVAVVRIGSASYSANADKYDIGMISIDGSESTMPALLAEGPGKAHINVHMLHCPISYAASPAITVVGPKQVVIFAGGGLHEQFFRLVGSANGFPRVWVYHSTVKALQDITNLCTSDSAGFLHLREISNEEAGSVHDGWPTTSFDQHWGGAGLVKTKTYDYTNTAA